MQVLGKDVNLGRHISEDAAAKAYDKAAICARGKYAAKLNFALDDYGPELERLEAMTVAELAPVLRQANTLFVLFIICLMLVFLETYTLVSAK